MDSIINIKKDEMHKAIFEVIENTDIQFPLIRVKNFLVDQGFTFKEYESTEEILILSRNGKRAIVCPYAISFQELEDREEEKFNQVFNSYIISRSKIFFESAIQNQKASKINLIQNQRRTCVSNMYYSIHNCFCRIHRELSL